MNVYERLREDRRRFVEGKREERRAEKKRIKEEKRAGKEMSIVFERAAAPLFQVLEVFGGKKLLKLLRKNSIEMGDRTVHRSWDKNYLHKPQTQRTWINDPDSESEHYIAVQLSSLGNEQWPSIKYDYPIRGFVHPKKNGIGLIAAERYDGTIDFIAHRGNPSHPFFTLSIEEGFIPQEDIERFTDDIRHQFSLPKVEVNSPINGVSIK